MRTVLFLASALSVAPGLRLSKAPSCATTDPRIESLVASKARELNGTEHCQSRIYRTAGDLDGDGTDDLLLVFSIEAIPGRTDQIAQFLAAFLSGRAWGSTLVEVPDSGGRMITSVRVDKGVVVAEMTGQNGEDGACCLTTSRRQMRFKVTGGQLAVAPLAGVDCGNRLHPNLSYKDWHQGPTLAFFGEFVVRQTYQCPEGTCFRADMTFQNWRPDVDLAIGFWKGSHVEFRRYVDSAHYTQRWQGECFPDSIEGSWFLEINKSDTGPFWIRYH